MNKELAKFLTKIKLVPTNELKEIFLKADFSKQQTADGWEFKINTLVPLTEEIKQAIVNKTKEVDPTASVFFTSTLKANYADILKANEKRLIQDEDLNNNVKKIKDLHSNKNSGLINSAFDHPTYATMKELEDNTQNVVLYAWIMKKEVFTTKTGKKIYQLWLTDNTDSVKAIYYGDAKYTNELDDFTLEEKESDIIDDLRKTRILVGDWIAVKGKMSYSNYDREQVFTIESYRKWTPQTKERKDNAQVKRVELHTHTKMSAMDGVSLGADYIKRADQWGWNAIAVTDHLDVQAFPETFNAIKAVNAKRKEKGITPLKAIYGAELNMIDDEYWMVNNPKGQDLETAKYCVFDLETSGLSPKFDEIIEFGAVNYDYATGKRENIDILIKPKKPLKEFTKNLTNITDEMLENAMTIEEAFPIILKAIKGRILVAHNANFDFDFLQSNAKRLGYAPLDNTVIDTLTIVRAFLPTKNYKLGTVSKNLGINYDQEVAHRGDYDAEVLLDDYERLLAEFKKSGLVIQKDTDLPKLTPKNRLDDMNFVKGRGHHVQVLVKNQEGIKDLYKLITISTTKDLWGTPKILKSELLNIRKKGNILIGSGCQNGEVFDSARTDDVEKITDHIKMYDFIEIQPLSVYSNLVEDSYSEEDLKKTIKLIIDLAKENKKPVVATSDAHYADPELKEIRDVYINAMGLGGARHPLFNYKDPNKSAPDQFMRTTTEMLEEFAWLNDEKLINQIVIKFPNLIADMVSQDIEPVKSGSYPPHIKDSEKLLTDKCYKTAMDLYGYEGQIPEIITKRLERELGSINKFGYSVIYWISALLVEKSMSDGYLVGSRGSVGSSLVATMSGVTEINPLKPHYRCPNCKYSEWDVPEEYKSGFDLPEKACPKCETKMIGDGQNIPFETFLGFDGDKVPDIDLNFGNEYQWRAHNFTKEIFGESNVFRAGTISTVAEKTAYGYVLGLLEKEDKVSQVRNAEKERIAGLAEGVKRTTGQHPGGIVILPEEYEIEDFTPVSYPADDINAPWKITHLDYHNIHDNLLKMDILGHVDPTALRMLYDLTGYNPLEIPMDDKETYSLFTSTKALGITSEDINGETTGAIGLPEFGTPFVRGMLRDTEPKTFNDLVRISGLSHGTDVWLGNAKDLIDEGTATLSTVIGCRDDIMTYLISMGMDKLESFTIMESVRKGKGLKKEWRNDMLAHNVPQWYITSCLKIKYLFPAAHANSYCKNAYRIAWYKVHFPEEYYATWFTTRADAFDLKSAISGYIYALNYLNELESRKHSRTNDLSVKERSLLTTMEVVVEMLARKIKMTNIDLNKSKAKKFDVQIANGQKEIVPPFNIIDSLGESVAESIVEARKQKEFTSKADFIARTKVTKTQIQTFEELGIFENTFGK